ncbi:MAG: dienelactone hydrolase [Polaromonas sp.]|nr:dienelactone hydrolase [Polaromonas sp.]
MNESPHVLVSREIRIPCGDAWLYGDLTLPADALGVVLFVHGGGSGRHSARNRQVARRLQQAGVATLLFDLLTAQEEQIDFHTREHRLDMALLTRRIQDATLWAREQPDLAPLPMGYFGANTGSAAAIIAAARLGKQIGALVLRGPRPDLAGPVALAAIAAPTLLIVGSADARLMDLNAQALAHFTCEKRLSVVQEASHHFEERGAMDQVADLAASWFGAHLAPLEGHPRQAPAVARAAQENP